MSTSDNTPYPRVPNRADFPAIERAVLDRWAANNTFQDSIDARPEDDEYVFYDGPPFANGLPHHGHLLTGYVKDVVPRYQTMLGKRVDRRFGWDCHGLPAEMETEQELGVSGRVAITEHGSKTSTRVVENRSSDIRVSGRKQLLARLGGWTLRTTTKPWI